MRRLRDQLTPRSKIRYLLWRLSKARSPIIVQLLTGEKLILRPRPTTDLDTAYEIFVAEVYRPPSSELNFPIQTIVDLGANVGYSCLYWLHQFREAKIAAYEPHPAHVAQIRQHLALNGCAARVSVMEAAVGLREETVLLSHDENRSRVLEESEPAGVKVRSVDWITHVGNTKIDFLKIDIEGSEIALLSDPRFGKLQIRALVMEWHTTTKLPNAREWCLKRLSEFGFRILREDHQTPRAGLMWAVKT